MRQTLTKYGDELELHGKSPRKCSFCLGFHQITSCGKLINLQTNEKIGMHGVLDVLSKGILGIIHCDLKPSNFIILEATIVNDTSGNHVEDLNYQITMLKKNAELEELITNQWINGTQMLMLVAHPHETIKYVFDKPIKYG